MSDNVDRSARDYWDSAQRAYQDSDPSRSVDAKLIELGGAGPHDPGMEARVAVLEEIASTLKASLIEIKTGQEKLREVHDRDFRLTFGAIISVALGLAGLMLGLAGLIAKGFHWF